MYYILIYKSINKYLYLKHIITFTFFAPLLISDIDFRVNFVFEYKKIQVGQLIMMESRCKCKYECDIF